MMRAALAVAALLGSSTSVLAEGEQTPMFGGSVIGSRSPDASPEVAGVQIEIAFWRGRIGAAIEGAQQWGFDREMGPRVTTVGGSLRVLAFRGYTSSWIEPRDVEFGIELHGVVERAWWQEAPGSPAPVRYGGGIAVRLRGGGDDFSNLLAESRLFVRVLATKQDRNEIAAREMTGPTIAREREVGLVIGLGASWGGGQRAYVDRFRPRPLDTVDSRLIR